MNFTEHIEGLKKGSYSDFKILYEEYSDRLYGFIFNLTRSKSMANDIMQETFIKVWINRENIDPSMSFKSYLFKISKNKITDEFRKQINNPVFEDYMAYCDKLHADSNDIIEQKIDFDYFLQKLDIAKTKLTSRQREIFELSKEEGFSSSEIAKILNISEQTTYNILSSAMKILRKEMGLSSLLFLLFFD
ncbi:MAG: RNA polymerase sigma factor [Prevotella sp.]|nr:RNA polymerase sigma factor [Prevotella sp.]